ncbi:putative UDP-glucose,sterol transferase [Aspergillus lucknowensis]|uniref:Glycosyltransferase family 28 N-terminal domain-containing protein n=1 Tax=Aspergillus lucknowensis TaxID=176173 RepID=A0ABR4M047_9EURO
MSHHAGANGIASEDWPDLSQGASRAGHRLERLDTGVRVMEDGRLDIKLSDDHEPWLQRIARHTTDHPYPAAVKRTPSLASTAEPEPEPQHYPRLNIVIQVIGSRGDIQPFLAIGQRLHAHGHRVRVATHLAFRSAVEAQGLEFFSIGGDPAELMAFMVKNPGLVPGMRTIRSGEIRRRRREMRTIFEGCWRSCYETGDGTGLAHRIHIPRDLLDEDGEGEGEGNSEADYQTPFVADVMIANPPSFAHLSCAEKLGVPLNMMFTYINLPPAFPHPLANIRSQTMKPSVANFASYAVVEIMLWEGLGDLINRFRKRELGLDPLDALRAPGIAHRLHIPYTYLWSPSLLEKPLDWPPNIDVVGFATLPSPSTYTPPSDLQTFLDSGPQPVYIGFGSIVVDNPTRLTNIVFAAIRAAGVRAVVSRGWGNIGAQQSNTNTNTDTDTNTPPGVMLIDKCPHDWLFQHVSCVVHHGGAGTTAAGLAAGRPTVIIPFFGDQTFWGSIVARAGAGPEPIPYKSLTAERLADAIRTALDTGTVDQAARIREGMRTERGTQNAVCSFYRHLDRERLSCSLFPDRVAVWWVKHSHLGSGSGSRSRSPPRIKLSAFAATVLVEMGVLKPGHLVLYRAKEYDTSRDPRGPISAGAEVLYGVVTDFVAAMTEFPSDMAEMFRGHRRHHHRHPHRHLRHGQPVPCPVHEWKDEHGTEAPDSGVGSSNEADSQEIAEDSGSNASRRSQSESESEASIQRDNSESQGPSEPVEANTLSSVVTQTSDLEMKTLSLENTLRRQQSREQSLRLGEVLTDAQYHGTRAAMRLLDWMLLLPTDLTLSFSKGFHNAPKLYHDPMVQETPTVRGVRGGLRAAGTEFTQEMYQGITGLVTQPRRGQRDGGTKGMMKGVGKGVGGLFLKPAAGLWGLVGYPLDGLHKALRTRLGRSKVKDILASRISQGLAEMAAATPEERAMVLRRWNEIHMSRNGKGSQS